jgi:FtsP/CotA-like multicopper oxidase with cupredoxin domain
VQGSFGLGRYAPSAVLSLVFVLSCLSPGPAQADAARAQANDNRKPAGVLKDGVLTLDLELGEGRWFPEAETGNSIVVQTFAEQGGPPQIPGPLIRVPLGTVIHARVRNTLATGAVVYGLHERPAEKDVPLEVPTGEMREVRFPAGAPGTYHYWAATKGKPMRDRFEEDATLSAAFIVDAPGAPVDERVFVIALWARDPDKSVPGDEGAEMLAVNGKAWPYSERLTYRVGETVRWRWINPSVSEHPMHLHGAHYRVDSVGDGLKDEMYAPGQQRLVVTENMQVGGTMTTTWQPPLKGRWVFHCHILFHISPDQSLVNWGSEKMAHGDGHGHEDLGMASGMKGLVLGITVLAEEGSAETGPEPDAARRLRLLVRERPATWSAPKAHVFQLQEGTEEPKVEEATVPGPLLLITRDQLTEIEVVNQLQEETAVHWHGIELESYYDGVPGWGGHLRQVTPSIKPGGSFLVRMAPPRSGTYIYHTHWHDELQLSTGMYGALLVMEPGQQYDPDSDKVFVISRGGPDDDADPLLLNGSPSPRALQLKTGVTYRLRFINITAHNSGIRVYLRGPNGPVQWRAVAKDGADLPPAQAILQAAKQGVSVGETYDFELRQEEPGGLQLEVYRPAGQMRVVQALSFTKPE